MSNVKYLLTGRSGFLGKVVANVLLNNGHDAIDINELSGKRIDIRKEFEIKKNPDVDVVVHMAGKAHSVPRNGDEAKEFFKVNYDGTVNLCKALTKCGVKLKNFILISTVAVYGIENGELISESEPLLGKSPYAESKRAAEEYVLSWAAEHDIKTLIFRLPLVVGPNPPGNLGKMINGIKRGTYLTINKGKAKRSMVMAADIGYAVSNYHNHEGIYNLTDSYHPSFRELEVVICRQLKKSMPLNLWPWLGKMLGKIGDRFDFFPITSNLISKMSNDLTFDDEKARIELGWTPSKVLEKFKIV